MANNNLNFIDLFGGCGGLSLGLEQAGFEPLLFNEINSSARLTYKENIKHRFDPIIIEDVKTLTSNRIDELKVSGKLMG